MTELRFFYQPVVDLDVAMSFYSDVLGFEEAWRDGALSTAYWMPGRCCQVMLSVTGKPAGPMYRVDSLTGWIQEHPALAIAVEEDIAGTGRVAGFQDPDGNIFYIFDQPPA